jgi:hypothetical protein
MGIFLSSLSFGRTIYFYNRISIPADINGLKRCGIVFQTTALPLVQQNTITPHQTQQRTGAIPQGIRVVGRVKKKHAVGFFARLNESLHALFKNPAARCDPEFLRVPANDRRACRIALHEIDARRAPREHFESDCAASRAQVGADRAGKARLYHVRNRYSRAFHGRPELQGVSGNADDSSLEETGGDPRVHESLAMERDIVLMKGLFAGGKYDIGADLDRTA